MRSGWKKTKVPDDRVVDNIGLRPMLVQAALSGLATIPAFIRILIGHTFVFLFHLLGPGSSDGNNIGLHPMLIQAALSGLATIPAFIRILIGHTFVFPFHFFRARIIAAPDADPSRPFRAAVVPFIHYLLTYVFIVYDKKTPL